MQISKFGNEPLDLKLFLLYGIRRIRFVFYGLFIGAFLFAAVYYLSTTVFAGKEDFVSKGELYLKYSDDVRLDNIYINDYTWSELIYSDKAYEYAQEFMDTSLERAYIEQAVSAGLVSDVRFVTVQAKTEDPKLSCEIATAYMNAVKKFGTEMVDIDEITVYTMPKEGKRIYENDRIGRMTILGAVIGFFAGFFYLVICFCMDDSVIVGEDITRRFSIPVIGMISRRERKKLSTECDDFYGQEPANANRKKTWTTQYRKINLKRVCGERKKIAVLSMDDDMHTQFCMKILNGLSHLLAQEEIHEIDSERMKPSDAVFSSEEFVMDALPSMQKDITVATRLKDYDGVILLMRADSNNGELYKLGVNLLRDEGADIIGAVLFDGDAWLWSNYYFPTWEKGGNNMKSAEGESK